MSDVTLNVTGLDKLLRALRSKPPVSRVGVLGSDSARKGKGHQPTNAEIGAAHEYGAPARGLPQRSFLRVPIAERLQKEMESSGAFTPDVLSEVIRSGSVLAWMKKVAVLAEGIVSGAFDSAGYGKWAPWAVPGYKNNAGQILVDTKQLRDSITSEVKA